jgi:DNA-binding response OmpR family regulator
MGTILVVEDEPHMQQGLRDNLQFEGYDVDLAADGEEGLQKILASSYDLVLLDVMLPRLSGLDVCRAVRRKGLRTPIIMLTARGEEIDKVLGLELGADDYITKPFSLRELLARVKAVLRRSDAGANAPETVRIGELEVGLGTYEARRNGASVDMTHREFEVLKYLYEHSGEAVSREQLLTDVWGYEAQPTTRTVDNFILKLRQKVEDDPAHPRHILTVHGIGYKLVQGESGAGTSHRG